MTVEKSPFPIRGAIEGFYGTYYTFPERDDLIRFLGKHGFNFYLYAPKNDRQHRARWREPYPPRVLEDFARTVGIARCAGASFCYAISFGAPIDFCDAEDFNAVTDKFQSFFDRGCRSFGVLFDDAPTYYDHGRNRDQLRSPAHAHSDFSNRLYRWVQSLDRMCTFYVCPADYWGSAPFTSYLRELGHELHPDIKLFYTGAAVCSRTISLADVLAFEHATGRAPMMWDNYPVNDLKMRPELHLGPLMGRDPRLSEGCAGYAANLMNQAEASKIVLLTTAEYLRGPRAYDPETAWRRALAEVAGPESAEAMHRLAENSLASSLTAEGAPEMDRLAIDVLHRLMDGEPVSDNTAIAALSRYLDTLDESLYHLRNRMDNLALRQNLLLWIEALDAKVWLGRFTLTALRVLEQQGDLRPARSHLKDCLAEVRRDPKRMGGDAIVGLAEYAYSRVRTAPRSSPRGVVLDTPLPAFEATPGGETSDYLAEGG